MADKPSRGLILYGDGLARLIGSTHTHLHSFASRACCGFLALPHSPPAGNEDTRMIKEFAELLDANEAYDNADSEVLFEEKSQTKRAFPTVAERFMGMKVAIITDNLSLRTFGGKLGLTALHWNELCENSHSMGELPHVTSGLLQLLGFQEGKTSDASQFDLVFVHVGAKEKINNLKDIEFVNNLVGEIMDMTQSGVDIGSRLHMSVTMSYGPTLGDDHLKFSFSDTEPKNHGELSSVIPRQSYAMKGGKPRQDIRHHCAMLLAQYQNAVTRKDMVKAFSFGDFLANGGNLVIPASRFLHEVAFKLWKAPKYGA